MKWIARENLKVERATCPSIIKGFTLCGSGLLGISGPKGLAQLAQIVEAVRDRGFAAGDPLGW